MQLYVYGCVIAFYLLIVSKIIKKAHSDSVLLSIFRDCTALPLTLLDNNLTRVVLCCSTHTHTYISIYIYIYVLHIYTHIHVVYSSTSAKPQKSDT